MRGGGGEVHLLVHLAPLLREPVFYPPDVAALYQNPYFTELHLEIYPYARNRIDKAFVSA